MIGLPPASVIWLPLVITNNLSAVCGGVELLLFLQAEMKNRTRKMNRKILVAI